MQDLTPQLDARPPNSTSRLEGQVLFCAFRQKARPDPVALKNLRKSHSD